MSRILRTETSFWTRFRLIVFVLFIRWMLCPPAFLFYKIRCFFRRDNPGTAQNPIRKICVTQYFLYALGLGDFMVFNSILKLIHDLYADAEVYLVAYDFEIRQKRRLYTQHSYVHGFVTCPNPIRDHLPDWVRFVLALRRHRFDLCVMSPYSLPTIFPYLAGIPQRIGHLGMFLSKRMAFEFSNDRPCHWTAVTREYYRMLTGSNDLDLGRHMPIFRFRQEECPELQDSRSLVSFHACGGTYWNRRWPLENFCRLGLMLCQELRVGLLLLGGASEHEENERIRNYVLKACPGARIHNFCGASYNRTANAMRASSVFVGNDSGPLHMAVTVGTPVVIGLFGSSDRVAMNPTAVHPNHMTLTHGDRFGCRPPNRCDHGCPSGFDPASPAYPKCMMAIEVEEVRHAVERGLRMNEKSLAARVR